MNLGGDSNSISSRVVVSSRIAPVNEDLYFAVLVITELCMTIRISSFLCCHPTEDIREAKPDMFVLGSLTFAIGNMYIERHCVILIRLTHY
jgi:hypothetical protein